MALCALGSSKARVGAGSAGGEAGGEKDGAAGGEAGGASDGAAGGESGGAAGGLTAGGAGSGVRVGEGSSPRSAYSAALSPYSPALKTTRVGRAGRIYNGPSSYRVISSSGRLTTPF